MTGPIARAVALSPTIITERLAETRAFYETWFGAEAVFECSWYVQLRLADGVEICLMTPQEGAPVFQGGTTLNLRFADADSVWARFAEAGVAPVMPLEDHPWGDRGFGVVDPSGVTVYCYHPIAPSEAFASFFREARHDF